MDIAHRAWVMALRVINLDKHLKTGRKMHRQILGHVISLYPSEEHKTYDMLNEVVALNAEYLFQDDNFSESIMVNIKDWISIFSENFFNN